MSRQNDPNNQGRVSGILEDSKATNPWEILGRLLSYMKDYRWLIIFALISNLLASIINIISPRLLGNMINSLAASLRGLVQGGILDLPMEYLIRTSLVLIVLYILNFCFSYLGFYLLLKGSQSIIKKLRTQLNDKILKLPISFLESSSRGDLMSRATNDVENVATTFQQTLSTSFTSALTMLGSLIMMVSIDWQLTFISVVFIPIGTILVKNIVSRSKRLFQNTASYTGQLNSLVEEVFNGHEVIKTFGAEKEAIEEFEEINQALFDVNWKSVWVAYLPRGLSDLIKNIALVAIAIWGSIKVMVSSMALGDLQAFVTYTNMFVSPIQHVLGVFNTILAALASAERIFEILDQEEEKETGHVILDENSVKGRLVFDKVSFGYEKNLVLKDINIEVNPGEQLAIVGPTGSGKTTLVKLVMRFYDPRRGSIILDGTNIEDYSRASMRETLGMVIQDTWLFEASVHDNIAFGGDLDKDCNYLADRDNVIQAAKRAHAHDFIMALPQGYDTILSNEAGNISHGQRQLLTIARAFISEPKMVILDEATSSVDTRTELAIQEGLNDLLAGRTSIIIAHRLSTIRKADKIMVLNNKGKIEEVGSHEELMAKGGTYKEAFMSQFDHKELIIE